MGEVVPSLIKTKTRLEYQVKITGSVFYVSTPLYGQMNALILNKIQWTESDEVVFATQDLIEK